MYQGDSHLHIMEVQEMICKLHCCTVVPRFTITPHYDESASRRRFCNGLNRVFSLCDDRFPALGTDSSQNDVFLTADRRFQNGYRVIKMAPHCV